LAAKATIGERRSLVRAKILYGVKPSLHVVERKLSPIKELYGRAAPQWYVFHPTDGDELAFHLAPFKGIAEFRIEGWHARES
jgi:hypothetical protein